MPLTALRREQPRDGLALDQFARLVEVVVDDRLRVDAERVVDGRQQLGRVDGVGTGTGAGLVRLPVDVAALDAGAGEDRAVTIRPVVAAVGAAAVAGDVHAALR